MHRNLCLTCRKPCGRLPAFGCNPGDATCIDETDCQTCEEHCCLKIASDVRRHGWTWFRNLVSWCIRMCVLKFVYDIPAASRPVTTSWLTWPLSVYSFWGAQERKSRCHNPLPHKPASCRQHYKKQLLQLLLQIVRRSWGRRVPQIQLSVYTRNHCQTNVFLQYVPFQSTGSSMNRVVK